MNEQQAFMELVDAMVAAYQKLIPFVDLEQMATILPQSASALANVETKKSHSNSFPYRRSQHGSHKSLSHKTPCSRIFI